LATAYPDRTSLGLVGKPEIEAAGDRIERNINVIKYLDRRPVSGTATGAKHTANASATIKTFATIPILNTMLRTRFSAAHHRHLGRLLRAYAQRSFGQLAGCSAERAWPTRSRAMVKTSLD